MPVSGNTLILVAIYFSHFSIISMYSIYIILHCLKHKTIWKVTHFDPLLSCQGAREDPRQCEVWFGFPLQHLLLRTTNKCWITEEAFLYVLKLRITVKASALGWGELLQTVCHLMEPGRISKIIIYWHEWNRIRMGLRYVVFCKTLQTDLISLETFLLLLRKCIIDECLRDFGCIFQIPGGVFWQGCVTWCNHYLTHRCENKIRCFASRETNSLFVLFHQKIIKLRITFFQSPSYFVLAGQNCCFAERNRIS